VLAQFFRTRSVLLPEVSICSRPQFPRPLSQEPAPMHGAPWSSVLPLPWRCLPLSAGSAGGFTSPRQFQLASLHAPVSHLHCVRPPKLPLSTTRTCCATSGGLGRPKFVLRKRTSGLFQAVPKSRQRLRALLARLRRCNRVRATAKLPAEMVADIVVAQGPSAGVRPRSLRDSRAGARKGRFWRVPWRFASLPQFQCKPYRMPQYMRQCNWNAFFGTRDEDRCKRCSS
jgi:hypothetical protein